MRNAVGHCTALIGNEMNAITRLLAITLLIAGNGTFAQDSVPLGRLFTTPQQRAALDRQRQLNPNFLPNALESESSLTLNGEVRRSSGHNTHWINGEASSDVNAPRPRVAVGDTLYPETGERESLLRGGTIQITPRKP